MCPHRDWFSTYDLIDSIVIHMDKNSQVILLEFSTIKVKTYDGVVRTLSNVRHIPNLK